MPVGCCEISPLRLWKRSFRQIKNRISRETNEHLSPYNRLVSPRAVERAS